MGRIVAAVGQASTSTYPEVAHRVEQAMASAVLECLAHGVTDAVAIRAAQLDARAEIVDQLRGG
jgi:hypothetical protein